VEIGEFINFVEIGGLCIIGLGGWTPLLFLTDSVVIDHVETVDRVRSKT